MFRCSLHEWCEDLPRPHAHRGIGPRDIHTFLVWIGIAAFGFTTFYGMYILSFLPEIPASEGEERQRLIETGAAIVAFGATTLAEGAQLATKELWAP